MPLLGSQTTKNQLKRKSQSDADSQYVHSLREMLKYSKNKNSSISNHKLYSQPPNENQERKETNTLYGHHEQQKSEKNKIKDNFNRQKYDTDEGDQADYQHMNMAMQSKANNNKLRKKNRYSMAFRNENPEYQNHRYNRDQPNMRSIKLPRLSKSRSPDTMVASSIRKRKFKTVDRQLIENYMNAILIEVENSQPKHPKIKKKPRVPKNHDFVDYNSPPPVRSMNSPKSIQIHHKTATKNDHRYSSRTENLQSTYSLSRKKGKESQVSSFSGYFLPHPRFKNGKKAHSGDRVKENEQRINEQKEDSRQYDRYSQKQIKEETEKLVSHYKDIKQSTWLKIDPLQLETYFYRLKNKKTNDSQMQSELKRNQFTIPQVPPKKNFSAFIKQYLPQNKQINIQDLLRKPTFQIIFEQTPDGSNYLYFGETLEEDPCVKQGKGILITDKFVFEGQWVGDVKKKGIEKSRQGIYKGTFRNNKRDGEGEFHWSYGEYYSGQWKQGKKSGNGYWRSSAGQSYMGEWSDGQVNGYGVHTMKNGRKFEGEFVNFLKHGVGKQVFPNGDFFQGKYIMGQPHGKGTYFWKSGYTFEGNFFQGYREGKGRIFHSNKMEFEGNFLKQRVNGMGIMRYENGDVFEGEYENCKRNGEGILKLKNDKKIIKGIWRQNELVQNNEYMSERQ